MVGPFILFDQAGAAEFLTAKVSTCALIGISGSSASPIFTKVFSTTATASAPIIPFRPGARNRIVADKGVTHGKRISAERCSGPHSLFAIQTRIDPPEVREDMNLIFKHDRQNAIPVIEAQSSKAKQTLGTACGETALATMLSETFYLDVVLKAGARFSLPDNHEGRGGYISQGSGAIARPEFEAGRMMVFPNPAGRCDKNRAYSWP